MKNKKIYDTWAELKEKYKELFLSSDEIWYINYNKLIKYIEDYDKLPTYCSKNKEIKKLGTWVSHQQNNYKNKMQIMKNKEIYDNWTKLKEKYKIIFLNNNEIWS